MSPSALPLPPRRSSRASRRRPASPRQVRLGRGGPDVGTIPSVRPPARAPSRPHASRPARARRRSPGRRGVGADTSHPPRQRPGPVSDRDDGPPPRSDEGSKRETRRCLTRGWGPTTDARSCFPTQARLPPRATTSARTTRPLPRSHYSPPLPGVGADPVENGLIGEEWVDGTRVPGHG